MTLWPDDVRDALIHLAESQFHAAAWKGIFLFAELYRPLLGLETHSPSHTRLYFPTVEGFSFEPLFVGGDTGPKAVVVRKDSKIYAAGTWEMMYPAFSANRPVTPSVSLFTPYHSSMYGGILRLFHVVGTTLSFSQHALRQSPNEIYRDPNSTLYDFYELEGQRMLEEHCNSWRGDGAGSFWELNLQETAEFLGSKEAFYPPDSHGVGVEAWRKPHPNWEDMARLLQLQNADAVIKVRSTIS